MVFERLLELVSEEPVFETGSLLAGKVKTNNVRRVEACSPLLIGIKPVGGQRRGRWQRMEPTGRIE